MKTKSDPNLLNEIREYGHFNTNACYQCGSCTVVCDLAKNSASFPRKMLPVSYTHLTLPTSDLV